MDKNIVEILIQEYKKEKNSTSKIRIATNLSVWSLKN